jgi:hypothetical protein
MKIWIDEKAPPDNTWHWVSEIQGMRNALIIAAMQGESIEVCASGWDDPLKIELSITLTNKG